MFTSNTHFHDRQTHFYGIFAFCDVLGSPNRCAVPQSLVVLMYLRIVLPIRVIVFSGNQSCLAVPECDKIEYDNN